MNASPMGMLNGIMKYPINARNDNENIILCVIYLFIRNKRESVSSSPFYFLFSLNGLQPAPIGQSLSFVYSPVAPLYSRCKWRS